MVAQRAVAVELVLGELADRLEQGVAGARPGVIGDHQRLAHERVEVPEDVDVVGPADHRDERGQVEATREDRGRPEQGSLVVGQQVVGPVDGVPECELAFGSRRAGLQQAEAVGEAVADLERAHRGHARRRQLDAERQPVDGGADLGDRGCGRLVGDPELGPHRAGSVDEERDRVGRHATVATERRDREVVLAGDTERLPGRGHDPDATGPGEERADRRRGHLEDVLAVVDHEQELPAGEGLGQRVDEGCITLRRDTEHGRDRRGHRVRVADRRELDEPDPVRELGCELGAGLDREPGLADAADAGQGHEPMFPDHLRDVADQLLSSDDRAELLRQVAGQCVDAAQDREVSPQPLAEHLEHRDPAAQPAEPVVAERPQGHAPAHQDLRRVGEEHLAPVGEGHQPGGAVDLFAEVVAVAFDGFAGVKSHADGEVDGGVVPQLVLDLDRRRKGIRGGRERGREAVTAGPEDVALVSLDRSADDGVVDAQGVGHRRGVLVPPTSGVLDVGEQEGDRPARTTAGHGRTVPQGGRTTSQGRTRPAPVRRVRRHVRHTDAARRGRRPRALSGGSCGPRRPSGARWPWRRSGAAWPDG